MVCNKSFAFSFVLPFSAFAPTFFVTPPVVFLHLATLTFTSDEKGWCRRGHRCLNSVWVPGANGPCCNIFFAEIAGGWMWVWGVFLCFLFLPETPFSGSFVPMRAMTNCLPWHFSNIHCSSSQVSCFDAWKTPVSCFLSCNLLSNFLSSPITNTRFLFLFLSLSFCRLLQMSNFFSDCLSPAPSQVWCCSLPLLWTGMFASTFFPFVYWYSSLQSK